MDAVADAKAELYAGPPGAGSPSPTPTTRGCSGARRRRGRRVMTFSAAKGRRGTWACVEIVSQGADGLRFVLGVGNREVPVHIPALVGAHNAANAAAAAAAAIALGCTDREIVGGLAGSSRIGAGCGSSGSLRRDPARRRLLQRQPRLDVGGAPPSWISPRTGGRPVAVLGDMLELGAFEAEAHRAVGEAAPRAGVRVLAAFGGRSRAAAEAARAAWPG